jgi:predicted O-methyltransferase YrrM
MREDSVTGDLRKPRTDAWENEPGLVEERSRRNPGTPAWHSWNRMSPEYEFCAFVAAVAEMVKPAFVIETGVGQGFTTRRIAAALPPGATLKGFESDDSWRERLASLPFFDGVATLLAEEPTPSDSDLAAVDLLVADSASRIRRGEVRRWARVAKRGAYIVVHDTGNRHPEGTPHHRMGALIRRLGISGVWLPNPRGSFLGQQS